MRDNEEEMPSVFSPPAKNAYISHDFPHNSSRSSTCVRAYSRHKLNDDGRIIAAEEPKSGGAE